jgi:hypothetical protein
MYKLIKLNNNHAKKYLVITPDNKKIRFGANGYSDYTIHKDPKRKERYIARHSVNEDWSNLDMPGTWSRYILWNKPTITSSIRDMEKLFDVRIKLIS